MALTGSLDPLRKAFADLAKPGGAAQKTIAIRIGAEVGALIAQQFAAGTGPDGSPHVPTKKGEPGLQSQVIGSARVVPMPGGVRMFLQPRWLAAHNYGHTFGARSRMVTTDALGKRMTLKRFGRLTSSARRIDLGSGALAIVREGRRSSRILARRRVQHLGERVLPQRQIFPDASAIPSRWGDAINGAASLAMREWAALK